MVFHQTLGELPEMVLNVLVILMNLSAVDVNLSSRCALGDVLPFFFRMERFSFVSPTVGSGTSTSCDAQPNFARTTAVVTVSDFWDNNLSLIGSVNEGSVMVQLCSLR